jgi:hypothetical protein
MWNRGVFVASISGHLDDEEEEEEEELEENKWEERRLFIEYGVKALPSTGCDSGSGSDSSGGRGSSSQTGRVQTSQEDPSSAASDYIASSAALSRRVHGGRDVRVPREKKGCGGQ